MKLCVQYELQSLAESSQTSYEVGQRHYIRLPMENAMDHHFPGKKQTMMLLATWLTLWRTKGRPFAFSTFRQYLSHVYELHFKIGGDIAYNDFFVVQRVMNGIKKVLGCESRVERY